MNILFYYFVNNSLVFIFNSNIAICILIIKLDILTKKYIFNLFKKVCQYQND